MLTNGMFWVYYHMQRRIKYESSAAQTFCAVGVSSMIVEYATVWSTFRIIDSDAQIKSIHKNINLFQSYIG